MWYNIFVERKEVIALQILVPEKYWYKDPLEVNIGYGETKVYYLLKYPNDDFPDYVAKIPADYVVLKNKKPSVISVWEEFVFEFEKAQKEPGKRFKRLKLSFDSVKELYKDTLNNMQYCILAFCNYCFNTIIRKAECTSAEIKIGKTDGVWFYDLDNPQERRKIKAKNTTFIKYSTEEEYLEFSRCQKVLFQSRKNINLLNEYLEDNQNHIDHLKKWYLRDYQSNAYTDEIFKGLNCISSYLKEEKEKAVNSSEHDNAQCRLFELVYSIDIKKLLGKNATIEFKDGSMDLMYSSCVNG